jgi:hypothetical protein
VTRLLAKHGSYRAGTGNELTDTYTYEIWVPQVRVEKAGGSDSSSGSDSGIGSGSSSSSGSDRRRYDRNNHFMSSHSIAESIPYMCSHIFHLISSLNSSPISHPLLSYRVLSPIRLPSSQSTPFSTHLLSQHCRLFSSPISSLLLYFHLSLLQSSLLPSLLILPSFSFLLTLSPPFLSSTILPRTIHYPPFPYPTLPYPTLSSPPLPLPSHPQQTGSYSTMLQHFSQFPLQEYAWNLADEILLGNMNVDTSSNNR